MGVLPGLRFKVKEDVGEGPSQVQAPRSWQVDKAWEPLELVPQISPSAGSPHCQLALFAPPVAWLAEHRSEGQAWELASDKLVAGAIPRVWKVENNPVAGGSVDNRVVGHVVAGRGVAGLPVVAGGCKEDSLLEEGLDKREARQALRSWVVADPEAACCLECRPWHFHVLACAHSDHGSRPPAEVR